MTTLPGPTFRHALLGCGRVAPNHVDAFAALDGWQVAVVCDLDPEPAAELAARFDIPSVETSPEQVLADPDITSVSILVDHAHHADLVRAALTAGKHVLVEKPLSLSVAEAEELAELADRSGLVLMVVSQHRYDPAVRAVGDWIAQGWLGELIHVRGELEAGRDREYYEDSYWRGTWRLEGGSALVNQGYHALDVIRGLVGGADGLVVRGAVSILGGDADPLETERTLSALMVGGAGTVPVTFTATVASSTTWRTRIVVVGSQGTVEFDIDHPARLHRATGNSDLERAAELLQLDSGEATPGVDYYGTSHRVQVADFAAAIATGATPATTSSDGVEMVELLDDLYQAAGVAALRRRPGRALPTNADA